MGEEGEVPADVDKARGVLINKAAELLKAPAWVVAAVVLIVGSVIAGIIFVAKEKESLEKDIHEQKESLQTAINTQKDALEGKINGLKTESLKNKGDLGLTLKGIRDSIKVLAAKSPSKDIVNEMLSARIGPIEKRLDGVQNKVEQQASLVRVFNPNQILAVVRSEVGTAQINKNYSIPEQGLVDLRNAVLTVPQATPGYWYTAQMVLNYTSDALVASGKIPDPWKVARPCLGTSQGNVQSTRNTFVGRLFPRCIVDLDTQEFVNVTFRDCVIRSRGGSFLLQNVLFVNCRFILELPEDLKNDNEKKFLQALLLAQTLSNFKANNG